MRFENLQDWLTWQESLSPKEIDLGLDRVSTVLKNLNFSADFFCPVITVAGTNGKGSTVAFAESILHQSGLSVGCYTSPHLFHYNERIRVNQQPVSDETLCQAFELIDQARKNIPLTYFEFGTLASLLVFKMLDVDVAVLEVGLGGRLDAVNVINPDVCIITSIAIDHVDWLGDDIEGIGREKAGIMRSNRPTVIGFFNPPRSVLDFAQQTGVHLYRLGHEYLYQRLSAGDWQLNMPDRHLENLPEPNLHGSFQMQNAAAAIMAIDLLSLKKKTDTQAVANGLRQVQLAGRYQLINHKPQVIVDVAHNEQSAGALSEILRDNPVSGKTLAIVGMLADKAVAEVLNKLFPEVDIWVSAGLAVPRGMSAKNMAQAVREIDADVKLTACDSVTEACEYTLKLSQDQLTENDRIIVFGSFYTVAEATGFFNARITANS